MVQVDFKGFEVDLNDYRGCIALMDKYGDSESAFFGNNEEGEDVIISINEDNITLQTLQDNGWIRTNVLWRDGTTEELYDR